MRNTVRYSGVVPQISAMLGPAAGGAVYSPALTDFIMMVRGIGQLYITGPDVVKAATGEGRSPTTSPGRRRGPRKQERRFASSPWESEQECLETRFAASSASSRSEQHGGAPAPGDPWTSRNGPRRRALLRDVVPDRSPNQLLRHDGHHPPASIDDADFMEVHAASTRRNIIVGFARFERPPASASLPSSPTYLAGLLDINASTKAARFIRFCDAFNVPLVTFIGRAGLHAGAPSRSTGGIIKHGAKLLYAYAEATVPKITVVTRKAYGGAYVVMGSKHLRTDINLAWPSAEIAVMGPDAAVNIIHRRQLRRRQRPRRDPRRAHRGVPRQLREPLPGRRTRLHRRRNRPRRRPGHGSSTRSTPSRTSATRCRPRSTATSPL